MATPVDAKQRAMSTYNAAADFYDHPVNTFWEWYGQETVDWLRSAKRSCFTGSPISALGQKRT